MKSLKRSFGDMGQPTSYGRYVHLYVNGLYFGLHDLTERVEDDLDGHHSRVRRRGSDARPRGQLGLWLR